MSATSGGIEVTPGFVPDQVNGETITWDKISRLVTDAVLRVMAGSIGPREITPNSLGADQLSVDLSAQLGVPAGSVTLGKLASGFLLPISLGGTGAATAASSLTTLGISTAISTAVSAAQMQYSNAKVFSGNAPTSYTDKDLTLLSDGITASGLPAARCFVHLRITNKDAGSDRDYYFKTKGDSDVKQNSSNAAGTSVARVGQDSNIAYVSLVTNASGIVQWLGSSASSTDVEVVCYQVLNVA